MTDPDEVKLLPCPFCGKVPVRVSIGTASCDGLVDGREVHNTIGMRPECWRARPPVVTDEVVERVAEVETGLRVAMVASCNCEHEANISPKPEAHDLTCRYRVLYVAADLLADIRLASMPAVVSGT